MYIHNVELTLKTRNNVQVYNRTYLSDQPYVAHVMQYGDLNMRNDFLATYLGGGPVDVNDNYNSNSTPSHFSHEKFLTTRLFSQEDAHLLHLKLKVKVILSLYYCECVYIYVLHFSYSFHGNLRIKYRLKYGFSLYKYASFWF